jgi:hypothetical protein
MYVYDKKDIATDIGGQEEEEGECSVGRSGACLSADSPNQTSSPRKNVTLRWHR